ncbi:MAG: sugar transferase, partial [Chromatiales bacterium]
MSKAVEKCHTASNFDLNFSHEPTLFSNATRSWTRTHNHTIKTLLTSASLTISDLIAFLSAVISAHLIVWWFTGMSADFAPLTMTPYLGLGLFLTFLWFGLYPAVMMKPLTEFRSIVIATTLTYVSFLTMAMNVGVGQGDRVGILFLTWFLSLVLLPAGRSFSRTLFSRFSWWGQLALVVGQGEDAHKVSSFLESSRRLGLRPISVIDNPYILQVRPDLVDQFRDHWLVFAGDPDLLLGGDRRGRTKQKHDLTIKFRNTMVITSETIETRTGDLVVPLERVDLPEIMAINPLVIPLRCRIKRILDILVATSMCIAASPLILGIAGILKLTSPGPIFYRQTRLGHGGRHFHIYKFRTMEADADMK